MTSNSSQKPAHEAAVANLESVGLWQDAFNRFRRHKLGMFGAIILIIVVFTGLVGPLVLPRDPNAQDFSVRFAPPSLSYPMGVDDFGRDIFTRVVHGAGVSLQVGLIAVSLATVVGTTLGLVAGYTRSRILDEFIMRLMDVIFAFPAILLAIAILAALGRGVANAMVAIGIVYVPIFARITRGAVLSVRESEFIVAARAQGAGDVRIVLQHILPNILSPIIVEITLSLAFAILAEAALSFFGLGTQPPDPSWGRMLNEGRAYFRPRLFSSVSVDGYFPRLSHYADGHGLQLLG